jgi:hypothetical protein
MDEPFLAQLLEKREGQHAVAVEPPLEPAVALDYGPHRALEIGRGLFQPVIEELLGERLAGFPDARDAAIARVQ